MKVVTLNIKGVRAAEPVVSRHDTLDEYHYCFEHGMYGIDTKLVTIPLNIRDFPVVKNNEYNWESIEFSLEKGNYYDYVLNKGKNDKTFLVVWHLSPGQRGSATYTIGKNSQLIAEGYELYGIAGRITEAPCPVVLVTGPTMLRWTRTGELHGTPPHWVAKFDGKDWIVRPDDPAEE